jgi:hypothetical protein
MMEGEDDLIVTARVLPENRKVYETLIELSLQQGKSPEEINTQLFNAGLYIWVHQISEDLAAGPEAREDLIPDPPKEPVPPKDP